MSTPDAGARRELTVAVVITVVGAALQLIAAGRPWAHVLVSPPAPLPTRSIDVTGRALGGIVGSVALLALAGAAALVATRGLARRVVGAVLVVAGAAAVVALALTTPGRVRDSESVQPLVATGTVVAVSGRTLWPLLHVAGGVLVTAAGALVLRRGARWPALGAQYDVPSRRSSPTADQWAALDRGEDPTLR